LVAHNDVLQNRTEIIEERKGGGCESLPTCQPLSNQGHVREIYFTMGPTTVKNRLDFLCKTIYALTRLAMVSVVQWPSQDSWESRVPLNHDGA
jgi:hypothetical protein